MQQFDSVDTVKIYEILYCEKEYEQFLYNVNSLQSCLFVIDEFHLMWFPLHFHDNIRVVHILKLFCTIPTTILIFVYFSAT